MQIVTKGSADSQRSFLAFLRYKELIYFLTWREFKVRYKQTALGVIWTVLQPLLFAGVVGIILLRRGDFDFGFDGVSNIVVVFMGFALWQFFEGSFSGASNSLLTNSSLMKKVYFPRVIPLISSILTRFIDFFLSLPVFFILAWATDSSFHLSGLLYVIPGLLVLAITAFAIGLILAPLNVQFRDVKLVLPFFTRLMFFSSPIWYPFSIVPESAQRILLLNPVVSIIEIARAALFNPETIEAAQILYPIGALIVLLAIGIPLFMRKEGKLADYI